VIFNAGTRAGAGATAGTRDGLGLGEVFRAGEELGVDDWLVAFDELGIFTTGEGFGTDEMLSWYTFTELISQYASVYSSGCAAT
jgi:hypothetical protein